MNKPFLTLWKATFLIVIGIGIGIYVFQADLALIPGDPLTFSLTRQIVYGYHKGDVVDHCGNGSVQSAQGETCDGTGSVATCRLRNTSGSTSCTNECCSYCGDGTVNNNGGGETCDDGNTSNGDGCSSVCAVESGYTCSGKPSSCSTTCGDSVVSGTEECDDGNTNNNDACVNCQNAECGDGYVRTGVEECDDGNSSNTDSCNTSCQQSSCGDGVVQSGEECDYAIAGESNCNTQCRIVQGIGGGTTGGGTTGGGGSGGGDYLPPPVRSGPPEPCGNGVIEKDKGEECDNGRFNGVTDCSASCKNLICGDGIISSYLGEECEVGFETEILKSGVRFWYTSPACGVSCTLPACNGSDCTGGCQREILYTCAAERTFRRAIAPSPVAVVAGSANRNQRPPPPPNCGNGIYEPQLGEECDLGTYNSVSGCSFWCETLYCGDGEVSTPLGEECEPERNKDGSFIIPTCGTSCTIPSCYANGFCSGGCRIRFLDPCSPVKKDLDKQSVTPNISIKSNIDPFSTNEQSDRLNEIFDIQTQSICGNSVSENGEECDDGNTTDNDGCSSLCVIEENAQSRCGDGILEQWEECDNGDQNSDTDPNACRNSCRLSYCGDNIIDSNEQCDDGNLMNGDGCNARCFKADCGNNVLEISEECDSGALNSDTLPNTCRTNCLIPSCGDFIIDDALGELCDDGNANSDDIPNRCRFDCRPSYCGDGVSDNGEECDDGNQMDVDGCRNNCTLPVCGDGFRQASEECDDGNTGSGDGCSRRCTREISVNPEVFGVGLIVFFASAVIGWFIRKKINLGV